MEGMIFIACRCRGSQQEDPRSLATAGVMWRLGGKRGARVVRDCDTARNTERFAAVLEQKLGGASRPKELAQAMLY
jgi:hypothetical protein